MTIRDLVNKKKRNAAIVYFVAFPVFIISILVGINYNYKPIILFAVAAFIIMFVSLFYLLYGIRCPRCRNFLGPITSYFGWPFSISKKINYCPFCGIKMDEIV